MKEARIKKRERITGEGRGSSGRVMILTYSTINIKRVGVITIQGAALEGRGKVPHASGRARVPLSLHLSLNEGDAEHTCLAPFTPSPRRYQRSPPPSAITLDASGQRPDGRMFTRRNNRPLKGAARGNSSGRSNFS